MKKRHLQFIIKLLVSSAFLFIVFLKIDTREFYRTVQGSYIPLAAFAVVIGAMLAFVTALRWMILLRSRAGAEKISYLKIWKLTMVGILFNNFLPTGAGGDIAKAFYLVKGQENKLLLGGSVIMDRFIGAFTVISMGVVAALLTPGIAAETKYAVSLLLAVLVLILLFFSNRRLASALYAPRIQKLLPAKLKHNLANIYTIFNSYFTAGKWLMAAFGISFFVQSLSIMVNYMLSASLLWGQPGIPNLSLFFIYIPLIWTSTLIPSLGGLGVRELTYIYFFAPHMGEENAFALSVLFLCTVILQSIAGAVIFLFVKLPPGNDSASRHGV